MKLNIPDIITGRTIPPSIEMKNAENDNKRKQQKFENATTIIALILSGTSIVISIVALILSIILR